MSIVSKVMDIAVGKSLLPQSQGQMSLSPSTYSSNHAGMFFWGDNFGKEYFFSYNGYNDAVQAYQKCAPLTAIINRKTQAYINGKTWVLNTRGKEATGDKAATLRKLMMKPNPLQSGTQFEAQAYCYAQIFGYALILSVKPIGFKENIDASALWNIPPFMVDIEETNKLFYQTDASQIIKSIVINYKGERTNIPVEDVFILKDIVPSFSDILFPESRIQSLAVDINNIIGANESINTLINFRGAQGFLTPEKDPMGTVPLMTTDKEALQNDFRRYGLKRGQWQVIISNAALKWQQMGYPTKDLLLLETKENAVQSLCDGYNYPFRLLSSNSSNSLGGADAGIFNRSLYQDTIIPESISYLEQWNSFFDTAKYNITLSKDYSHVHVLQADGKLTAEARLARNNAFAIEWEKGLITRNQWRVANGEDPVPGDDLFITQLAEDKSQPLAVSIGVGGVQGLIEILSAQGISNESRQAALEIVFGLQPSDAARMTQASTQTNNNGTEQQQQAGQ
jgi:Phage portal protein